MSGDRLLSPEDLEAIRRRAESKSGGAFDFLACARDDVHALLSHAEALAMQVQVRDAMIRDRDARIAGDNERSHSYLEAMKTLTVERDAAREEGRRQGMKEGLEAGTEAVRAGFQLVAEAVASGASIEQALERLSPQAIVERLTREGKS